ncbi:hypothetical protein V7138_07090 [Bacillus sp. JJ1533]
MKHKKINTAKGIKANQEIVEFKPIQQGENFSLERQHIKDYNRAWEDDRL